MVRKEDRCDAQDAQHGQVRKKKQQEFNDRNRDRKNGNSSEELDRAERL